MEYNGNMIAQWYSADRTCCSVLNHLQMLQQSVANAIKQWVTVVQVTRDQCLGNCGSCILCCIMWSIMSFLSNSRVPSFITLKSVLCSVLHLIIVNIFVNILRYYIINTVQTNTVVTWWAKWAVTTPTPTKYSHGWWHIAPAMAKPPDAPVANPANHSFDWFPNLSAVDFTPICTSSVLS